MELDLVITKDKLWAKLNAIESNRIYDIIKDFLEDLDFRRL